MRTETNSEQASEIDLYPLLIQNVNCPIRFTVELPNQGRNAQPLKWLKEKDKGSKHKPQQVRDANGERSVSYILSETNSNA